MNIKIISTIVAAVPLIISSQMAIAVPSLFDWAVNIDGVVSEPFLGDPVPGELDISGFNDITGLGTITATITGAGAHTFDAFFDHEIDQAINTYFNETGFSFGAAAAGQSWEIDEPGWVDGDIFENFQGSVLDNGIGTSIYGDTIFPDDVSMAMGWDFSLLADETATISLFLGNIAGSGFFLQHYDPDSDESIFLHSTLNIKGGGGPSVPAPTPFLLLGLGLLGFATKHKLKKTA